MAVARVAVSHLPSAWGGPPSEDLTQLLVRRLDAHRGTHEARPYELALLQAQPYLTGS